MGMKESQNHKAYVAEFIGTFALVFAGTGAIIINDLTNGTISHVGIALTFGLVITAMIYTLGDISGAHFNPAVTFGFWIARRFVPEKVLPYILSQCAGGIAASAILHFLFLHHPRLGATIPMGSSSQAFIFEVILTFFLMFVIINVSTGSKEKGMMAGIAVGSIIGLEALFAGPISGASMNPVRSLAPALLSGNIQSLWIYLTAPFIGAYLAILGCKSVQENGCCSNQEACA